jgi:predicted small secreted protein
MTASIFFTRDSLAAWRACRTGTPGCPDPEPRRICVRRRFFLSFDQSHEESIMRKPLIAAVLASSVLLGGCATIFGGGRSPGAELVGRSAQLVPARGQPSTLYFNKGGQVRAVFGTRQAAGRWSIRNERLCFLWGGNFRECWPYSVPLRPGQTRSITSDRGNVVSVTLR